MPFFLLEEISKVVFRFARDKSLMPWWFLHGGNCEGIKEDFLNGFL